MWAQLASNQFLSQGNQKKQTGAPLSTGVWALYWLHLESGKTSRTPSARDFSGQHVTAMANLKK